MAVTGKIVIINRTCCNAYNITVIKFAAFLFPNLFENLVQDPNNEYKYKQIAYNQIKYKI